MIAATGVRVSHSSKMHRQSARKDPVYTLFENRDVVLKLDLDFGGVDKPDIPQSMLLSKRQIF